MRVVSGKPAEILEHEPDSDDDELLQWLSMSHGSGLVQSALGMPQVRKYLPPGTVSDLYELFVVTQKGAGCEAVSWSTFLRVYTESIEFNLWAVFVVWFTSCIPDAHLFSVQAMEASPGFS